MTLLVLGNCMICTEEGQAARRGLPEVVSEVDTELERFSPEPEGWGTTENPSIISHTSKTNQRHTLTMLIRFNLPGPPRN